MQHLRNTRITTIFTTISSNNIEHEPYSLSFNDSRQVSQIELRLCIIAWRRDLGPESCTSWICRLWRTREDGILIKNILKQPSHAKYYNLESHQLTHTTHAKSCNLSKSCFQWSRQATTYSPGCPWPDVFLPPQPLLCPGDWKSIGNLKPWHLLQKSKDGELSKIKMLMVLWSCDWILSPTLADRYLDSAVVARWILDTKHWKSKSSHQVIQLNLGIAVCGLLLPPRLCLKGDSSNSGSRAASERKSHKTPDMMIYVFIHYIDLYNNYSDLSVCIYLKDIVHLIWMHII